jgi:hypothetical protein
LNNSEALIPYKAITIYQTLPYQPKKKHNLLAYEDSGINAIYKTISE